MSKNIIKSQFFTQKLNYQSISELIFDRLKQNEKHICIIDCALDRKWTKRQVLDSCLNFAYYLINDCNLSKGDVVCVVAKIGDIHAIASLGVIMAGGVYCTLSEDSTESEIQTYFQTTNPSIVVCVENKYETIETLSKDTSIKRILSMTSHTLGHQIQCQFVEEILDIKRMDDIELPVKTDLGHVVMYQGTSGSTGRPKAVIRTNANFLSTIELIEHREMSPTLTPDSIFYCWGYTYNFFPAVLALGAKYAIYDRSFGNERVVKKMHEFSITDVFLVPTQLYYLAKHYDDLRPYMSSLKRVDIGGATLSASTYKFLADKCDIVFTFVYGMSESGLITQAAIRSPIHPDREVTVGKITPNTEIKIIDEMGNSLPANMRGEICIRGGQVTPGYLNNSSENAKLFTSDGFLKSGDIGYYDSNDDFFIVGRIKDIIKVEGYVVAPVELENILVTHPLVVNAAVIGIADEEWDERPAAFVTICGDVSVDELTDYVNSRVSYFKKIRGGLKIVDAFRFTPMGKIDKQWLKELV